MPKPIFNPTQFELRNELPVIVSDEQASQIGQAVQRVNNQLDWVAQILGWNGANYWDSLANTVHQRRALLGGTYGVYNAYTLLPLKEIRSWEQTLVTEDRPNIAIGQRVIIGDQQAYIYDLERVDGSLLLNIGTLSETIIDYLERGAAIKVDCPENRPFPFYRPTPEASADAYFRCSVGATTKENDFYRYAELVLSPYEQNNLLLPYTNLDLFAGSYYYFDRAVYISSGVYNLAPWIEAQWIESKGLWQLYIPQEVIGNQLALVWDYAVENTTKRILASTKFQVVAWEDPSDWGNGGAGFNPVLDEYFIKRTYNTAGLNYSLGTRLALGDQPPTQVNSELWYDAGDNRVYANVAGQWSAVGEVIGSSQLDGESAPPPANYEYLPGTIWQSPENRVYIWDAGFENYDFFYFFPNGIIDGFFYIDPSSQNVQGLYLFDPDNFYIHYPNYVDAQGLVVYNCLLNDEGFYVNDANVVSPDWHEVSFYPGNFTTQWVPAYDSNLFVLVDGEAIGSPYQTANYEITWALNGGFLAVTYRALTDLGQLVIPEILVASFNGTSTTYVNISDDFTAQNQIVTSIPYPELGVLNNFRGVWGNKGGARSMDFTFDALDIHGYNEQQALRLRDVNQPISFDKLLNFVSGSNIYTGDSPPPSAKVGDYYWNNETGALAVYYQDRDRQFIWVEVDYPISPCQIGNPECDYFPLKPFLSTGGCSLSNGDTWQDPLTPAVTLWYDSPNGTSDWVEMNWNIETGQGWQASQYPALEPNFSVLTILLTDDFIPMQPDVVYSTEDYEFYYTIEPLACTFTFHYRALNAAGVQKQPTVWVGINSGVFPPQEITEYVFANAEWYLSPAVQNSEWTLRPWKSVSLEVTTESELTSDTFANPLRADQNLGPGDEDWARSFIRLPSEYGREGRVWNQAELAMQDMSYFGSPGKLQSMRCPSVDQRPEIFEELVFYNQTPQPGKVLFSAPFWYSDVEGFNDLLNYFPEQQVSTGGFTEADFDFVTDDQYDEWVEADLSEYDPLHTRVTVANGDWDGVYLQQSGSRPLSGFLNQDLRVKSVIPVSPPIWDASIYKYAPLCPQGPESYVEDPNNYKVNYAYFAADLAAAEDGFFDQSQDVAWREPLVEDQTLYMLN